MLQQQPKSTLFPYTTLFRSLNTEQRIRQLEIEKQKAIISGNKLVAKQKEDEIQLLSQQQQLRDARILQQERSEEHTSELQSQSNLVCRLLLEKKKQKK